MCLLLLCLSGLLLGLAGYQQDPGKNIIRISQSAMPWQEKKNCEKKIWWFARFHSFFATLTYPYKGLRLFFTFPEHVLWICFTPKIRSKNVPPSPPMKRNFNNKKRYNHFRSEETKQVLDFDESGGVINRLVAEEEEDEREDIVDVWKDLMDVPCVHEK